MPVELNSLVSMLLPMKTMYGYWDKVASVSLYWVYTYELSVVVALLWNKVPLEYIQRWIGKESYI